MSYQLNRFRSSRAWARIVLATVVLILPIRAQATTGDVAHRVAYTDGDTLTHSLLLVVEEGFSARSGAYTLQTVHDVFVKAENRTLGTRWFDEESLRTKVSGVLLRYAKLLFVDAPAAHEVFLLGHEVFGHGGRMRELGYDPRYELSWPPPYGTGVGRAIRSSLTLPGRVVTDDEQLVASGLAGFEVASIQRRELDVRWAEREEIGYGEALLFLTTFREDQKYVRGLKDDPDDLDPGHDVAYWLEQVDARAGFAQGSPGYLTPASLRARWYVNLANPFLAQSLYALVKDGLWSGSKSGRVLMIPVGDARWLPSVRITLDPFGPTYHLENTVVKGRRTVLLDIALGDPSFPEGWGSGTLAVRRLLEQPALRLDAEVSVWSQPELELGGPEAYPVRAGVGTALSVRGFWTPSARRPVSGFGEFWYKTAGYVEGRRLTGGLGVMLGMAAVFP